MSYKQNTSQCECHECTQARYRMSFRYQLDQATNPIRTVAPTEPIPPSLHGTRSPEPGRPKTDLQRIQESYSCGHQTYKPGDVKENL